MNSVDAEIAFQREMEAAGAVAVVTWGNDPGYHYSAHAHPYRKVPCCLDGCIVFHLPDGDEVLAAGGRLLIDPDVSHSASVGPDGVRCVEAHFD